MKTFFKILLYIIGFPALIALVVLESLPVVKNGITYAPFIYGGIAVAAVFAIIYFLVALITWLISRKAKTKGALRTCSVILVLVGFLFTTGVFIVVDKVLPDILLDATDDTITFDEIRENYVAKSDFHALLLEKFITMNVDNGNLEEYSLEEYLKQGWKNEEVKALITSSYESINEGFGSFVGPWLPLANDSRQTIPVIVHLIINERAVSTKPFMFKGEGREEAGNTDGTITWSILDIDGGDMSVDLSGLLGSEAIQGMLADMTIKKLVDTYFGAIVNALNEAVKDEALANTTINLGLDLESGELSIVPSIHERGVWDYMHHAWFNSNQLLFLVISLFPARKIYLIFGGWIVLLSLIIVTIRERQYGKNLKKKTIIAIMPEQSAVVAEDKKLSPYLKTTNAALEELYNRRGI